MVTRSLQIALGLALCLLLLLAAGGYWLLTTEPGANWVVRQLRPFLPPEIQLKSVHGGLLSNFALRGLSFQGDQGDVEIEQLRLNWQPQALWQQQIRITSLILDGVSMTPAATATEQKTPFALPDLKPLFNQLGGWTLLLSHFEVNDLRLIDAAGKEEHLAQLTTELELDRHQLQLKKIASTSDWGNWQAEVQLSAASKLTLQLRGHPPKNLVPDASLSAHLSLQPDQPDSVQGILALDLQLEQEPAYTFTGALTLSPDELRFTSAQLSQPDGRTGSIQGALGLTWQGQFAWDAQLELADLNLQPLLEVPTAISGTLNGRGGLENYTGQFDLRNQATGWQQLRLRGKLRGSREELAFTQLAGRLLDGAVQGDLDLNWHNGLHSNFKLTSQQLDLALLPSGPEGRVDLHLDGWLSKASDQPLHLGGQAKIDQARVEQRSFGGEIRGQWLGGRNLELDQLDLSGNWGRLVAQGKLQEHLELDLSLTDAAALWPPVQGKGNLSGWLAWPDTWPQGELTAKLQQLAYGEIKVASLNLAASRRESEAQNEVQMQLTQLEIGAYSWEELTLDLRGALSQHQLEAQVSHQGQELRLTLDGALVTEQWQGLLTRFELLSDAQPLVHLQKPSKLSFSREEFRLAPLKLAGEQGGRLDVAASGHFPDSSALPQIQTQLALENLPLKLFNPWLPVGQTIDGLLRASIDGQLQEDGTISLQGQANIRQAKISLHDEKTRLELPVEQLDLNLDWQKHQLQTSLELTSNAFGSVKGQLSLALPAHWPPPSVLDAPLEAKLDFHMHESGALALLLPTELAELSGQLDGQLQLAGTLAHPDFSGKLNLKQGQLAVPQLAIRLQPVELDADFAGQTLRISSFRAVSEKSQVTGQGEISFKAWKPEGYRFTLQGDRVLLVDLPEIRARFSPDLTFADQGSGLLISGRLNIPELTITNWHPTLPVNPSPDVVYVDEHPAPQATPSPYQLDLDLELGNKVTIKEKGLDVRLTGKVHLNKAERGEILARGQIEIPAGHYSAYAVKLPISSGRLYFTGGALDNPSLDIQANRKIGEVTAGVNISGTVRRPLIELVSDPAMDDTEILSYIILGRSTTTSSGELDMLSLAAGALLSAGDSVSMQQKLKDLGGIDVVSVENNQQGNLDATMVTVGKYLSPELYLSYGRSLAGTASEVQLRYSPGKRIEIETQLGEVSGADLYYKFEFE